MTESRTTSNVRSKKHVALVVGGMSFEREVSLNSASNVGEALTRVGHKITFVEMGTDIAIKLSTLKPDLVFNCLQGAFGENGNLPGLLNIMRLPYTHSGVFASSLAIDKIKSKQWFRLTGVATPKSVVVRKDDVAAGLTGDPMDRPYVIKPPDLGASVGIEVIFKDDDFEFANYTFPYGDRVLVERFIKGREFTVAVLDGKALGAVEVYVPESKRITDYEVKYSEEYSLSSRPPPPPILDSLNTELLASAEKIFKSFECRGPARIDYILEEETGLLYVLEINTHPGMTTTSVFPHIATNRRGMDLECIVDAIIRSAACDS